MNQLYVYIYPLFFGFPSHLGHHRALSGVPCAIQQVLISYLFSFHHFVMSLFIPDNFPFFALNSTLSDTNVIGHSSFLSLSRCVFAAVLRSKKKF